jgi:hypothetical protein
MEPDRLLHSKVSDTSDTINILDQHCKTWPLPMLALKMLDDEMGTRDNLDLDEDDENNNNYTEWLNTFNENNDDNVWNVKDSFLLSCIREVHCATEGHLLKRPTLTKLNRLLMKKRDLMEDEHPYNKMIFGVDEKIDAVDYFLRHCDICQKNSDINEDRVATTPFVNSGTEPFELIQLDHIGPLKEDAHGNNYILVMIDCFSRWVELYPVRSTEGLDTAICMIDYMSRYGPPMTIVTDKGSPFISQIFNSVCEIGRIMITHPRAGSKQEVGIAERCNREVRRHLNNLMNEQYLKDTWTIACRWTQRIINNSYHKTIGHSPAQLIMGKLIRPINYIWNDSSGKEIVYHEEATKLMQLQTRLISDISQRIKHIDIKHIQERSRKGVELKIHTLVLRQNEERNKQQLKYIGPYIVTDRDNDHYKLTAITDDKKDVWVHANKIKIFKLDTRTITAEEVALRDENSYVIEKVLPNEDKLHKKMQNTAEHKWEVKFKGYNDTVWMSYKELKTELPFIIYCVQHRKYNKENQQLHNWICKEARDIHQKSIDFYSKSRMEQDVQLKQEAEEVKLQAQAAKQKLRDEKQKRKDAKDIASGKKREIELLPERTSTRTKRPKIH